MSDAKHTPGPWTFSPTNDEMGFEAQVWRPDGHSLAIVELAPGRSVETNANARLIAAAPDMLAACERFSVLDCDPHATEAEWSQFRRDVAAVVANAKGDAVSTKSRS